MSRFIDRNDEFAVLEKEYGCDAFPYSSNKYFFIASKASISNFVVAA